MSPEKVGDSPEKQNDKHDDGQESCDDQGLLGQSANTQTTEEEWNMEWKGWISPDAWAQTGPDVWKSNGWIAHLNAAQQHNISGRMWSQGAYDPNNPDHESWRLRGWFFQAPQAAQAPVAKSRSVETIPVERLEGRYTTSWLRVPERCDCPEMW